MASRLRRSASFIVEVLNPLWMTSLALYVSVGYLLTLLAPVTIEHWILLFWISFAPSALSLARRFRREHMREAVPSFRWLLPIVPICLLLLPGLILKFSAPNHILGFHGDIQGAYINQLRLGATPVENIYVPGYPANYYWLFHAIIAPWAEMASFNGLVALAVFNTLAVFSALIWLGRALVCLGLAQSGTLYLGFAVALVYFSVNIAGSLQLARQLPLTPASELDVMQALRLMSLPGTDPRLHSVWGKVLGTTSVALGLTCFCAAFYGCLRVVRGDGDRHCLVLISASGIVALAVQQAMALGIVLLIAGIALLLALSWFKSRWRDEKTERRRLPWHGREMSTRWLCGWFLTSAALSLPLLHYLAQVSAYSSLTPRLRLPGAEDIGMPLVAVIVLLPFLALRMALGPNSGAREGERAYTLLCAGLLFATAMLLEFGDGNQYKLVYPFAILLAVVALDSLQALAQSRVRVWRRTGRLLTAALFVLLAVKLSYVNAVLFQTRDRQFYFDGQHLSFSDQLHGRAPALYWIREQSPVNAVLIMPWWLPRFDHIVTERLPYVKRSQGGHGEAVPVYPERVDRQNALLRENTSLDEYGVILRHIMDELPGRPLYALTRDKWTSQATFEARGAMEVLDGGDGFNVYWLNPD